MALFLPIAVLLPLSAKEIGRRWTVPMASVLACILLGSQFVSGGRAGIIAVVVSVLALTLFRSARVLALSIIAVSIVVGVVLFDDSCSRHLKLDRLPGLTGSSTAEASGLDALGTGRLAGYRVAIKEIVERPLLGHGLGPGGGRGNPQTHCRDSQPVAQVGGILWSPCSFVVCCYDCRNRPQRSETAERKPQEA